MTTAIETNFGALYGKGRHLPRFVHKAAAVAAMPAATPTPEPMTPGTAEVVVLTTGAWYPGWNATSWTPIPSFKEQWALAKTSQERASLLAFYSPTASIGLTHYQRSILMEVSLPASKSEHPDAELTFCDGTLRQRVCGFAYCVEDTPDGNGYWYCDECRRYGEEQYED
jgi:hypothetical protein